MLGGGCPQNRARECKPKTLDTLCDGTLVNFRRMPYTENYERV